MNDLWERVRNGQHTAVLGVSPGDPPSSARIVVVRVRCDVPPSTLGPLHEARRKIDYLLGSQPPLLDQARERMVSGLRRRLLGEPPAREREGGLVEAWNRLAASSDRPAALLFEAVDAADDATLTTLRRIVSRPGWLKLPLVLVFRTAAPSGAATGLLAALQIHAGAGCVMRPEVVSSEPAHPTPKLPVPPSPEASPGAAAAARIGALPHEVVRVLRAGAIVGSGFEADLVAALLDMEVLDVLERVQRAADAGVPVEDRGEGRFHLPESLLDALRASTLPSLMIAQHRRLAELLGGFEEEEEEEAEPTFADPEPAAPVTMGETVQAPARALTSAPHDPPPKASTPTRSPSAAYPPAAPTERRIVISPWADELGPGTAPSRGQGEPEHPLPGAWPYADLFGGAGAPIVPPSTVAIEETMPGAAPSLPAAAPPRVATFVDHPAGRPGASVDDAPPAPREVASPKTILDDARDRPPASAVPRSVVEQGPYSRAPRSTAPRSAGPARSAEPSPASHAPRVDDGGSARRGAEVRPQTPVDDARAAGHLAAAGDLDASAERYFIATQKAAASGAYTQALALADKALAALDALPESPRRRRLRAGVLLEVGRLRWITSAPDADFTLADAIEVLEAARRGLSPDDPPELRADAAVIIASVCYDIGDAPALARALDELTAAARLLLDAGDPTGAARLLNDQAAVYVRMGDPVRATHLLGESRRIFEERAATDPVAMVEMAETDHLFARIPLHVPARPGREADALTMGLDHALAAERAYQKLDARRELGRVWETMGRLELRKGRVERARERLVAAVQIEESIGDVVGLARSTAALSELLATTGRYREALGVLGDSVALNFEKGSPIGLAFNRRALDALALRAESAGTADPALAEVERELAEAEAVLGKMRLPGEGD